jgi:GTPase SAR1 family protein
VYDITDIDSFVKVKKWVKELHSMVGKNIAIAICGNKIDKEREKVVDLNEAEAFDSFLFLEDFFLLSLLLLCFG